MQSQINRTCKIPNTSSAHLLQLVWQSLYTDDHKLEGMFTGTLQKQFQLIFSSCGVTAKKKEGFRNPLVDVDDE